MRTNKVVTALAVTLFLMAIIGTVSAVDMKTFVGSEYTMDVPADWNYLHHVACARVPDPDAPGGYRCIEKSRGYRITDGFIMDDINLSPSKQTAYVTVNRWDNTKSSSTCSHTSSLDELADCLLADLGDRGAKGYSSYYMTINGERAWMVEMYSQYSYQGVHNLVHLYVFQLNKTVVYEIRCEAREFDKYNREYFEQMIQSFQFIGKTPEATPTPTPSSTPEPTPEPCVKYYNYTGERKYPDHFIDGYLVQPSFPDHRIVLWNHTPGVFDCSEMAAMYEWWFENRGYNATIRVQRSWLGQGHIWVMLERSDGTWIVWESTTQSAVLNETLINKKYKKFDQEYETIRDVQKAENHFGRDDDFDWWNNFDEYKDTNWCDESPNPIEVPGFGAIFAIVGLLVTAYLLRRRG
jgi:PGF-CTERM protein